MYIDMLSMCMTRLVTVPLNLHLVWLQEAIGLLWVWPESGPMASLEAATQLPHVPPGWDSEPEQYLPLKHWFMRDVPYSWDTLVENVVRELLPALLWVQCQQDCILRHGQRLHVHVCPCCCCARMPCLRAFAWPSLWAGKTIQGLGICQHLSVCICIMQTIAACVINIIHS